MLKGKVCIVTGSSGGIGAAIAQKFAKENADGIVLHGRKMDSLNKMKNFCVLSGVSEKNVIIVSGDVTDETIQKKLVNDTMNHFGRIDVLVNNAGIYDVSSSMDSSMELLDRIWTINVRPLVSLTKLCIPHLIATKGNIVNISTGLAYRPRPFAVFYSMGKACIDHYTRCLALELGPSGVRVNSVCPGYIPGTDIITRQGVPLDQLHQQDEEMKKHVPMHRFATPDDIAEAVAFVAGKAINTTGHLLPVDAGMNV